MPNWIVNDLLLKGDPSRIRKFLETTVPQPGAIKIGAEPRGPTWMRIHDVKLNHGTVDLGFLRIEFETAWVPPTAVLDRLQESFPDITFEFEWIDFDATLYERIEAGELVETSVPERPANSWNYPSVNPYQFEKAQWVCSALRLLEILAPPLAVTSEATQRAFSFYGRDVVDAMLVLIPHLMRATLAVGDVPQQRLVESLLRSCGYDGFANHVAKPEGKALPRPEERDDDGNSDSLCPDLGGVPDTII